jgi:putative addiction module antidote
MVLELKLRRIGNSVGVVLPKEALNYLNVDEGDTVSLTDAPDGSLRLSPADPAVLEQLAAAEKIIRRYRHTLRALAK